MTRKEFKAWIGAGYRPRSKLMKAARAGASTVDTTKHVPVSALPDTLDWRTHTPSIITPVKDQGGCGA